MNDRCEIGDTQAAAPADRPVWSALADAEGRAQLARSQWRRVMFDWPKLGIGSLDMYEAAEATARRELLEADKRLHEIRKTTSH